MMEKVTLKMRVDECGCGHRYLSLCLVCWGAKWEIRPEFYSEDNGWQVPGCLRQQQHDLVHMEQPPTLVMWLERL